MPRFFCPLPLNIGAQIDLPADTAHHIFVLRLNIGEHVELFNGEGGSYLATLTSISKKQVNAEVKVFLPEEVELPFNLSLAQALPEASKMDWIIEKAIELGVNHIQPLAAQRSVVKLNPERAEKKMQHWQGIIQSATEQCGRKRIAHLAELTDVQKWLMQQDMHKRILLSPRADQSLADWPRHHPAQALTIMIGPEGGFSDSEEQLAIKQGAIMLSMGPRVLRTETAGLTAISVISAAWGGM
ncbi:16S rRNA (uracil(1498)-N(3))-methyltransferase [Undibacterium seohonense]|uniref:Ribosomal RNA small subunit methyltransferase E n=1 Tax=Undibacterium seohonense TaxID=1344950 RepID=A0ABR6XAR0_9BURK|nr:16S rRNA (uracil(1498)-N(3))-methyltransferase [Undibacterium seohonense]MBC3809635.1 16S rRNA (uracil(1498)-N(3))-methyltransferase [Undibacterium seohonense]